LTSSIYPILPSLSAPIITAPGSGYTTTPTVTIDAPPSGTTATGIAVVSDGVINTISALAGGSLYDDGEDVTLTGNMSGIDATGIAVISGGVVQSITFTSRGSGFVGTETVTITGVTSAATNASFTVTTIANDAVSSITMTNGGTGYTSLPTITITGGGGSGATATAVFNVKSGVIAADTNILNSPITITSNMVSPGGGGILRLYFSFNLSASATISVRIGMTGDTLKGDLNPNNLVLSDGYYTFNIDVKADDIINLRSDQEINPVNSIRAQLIQFGA